MNLKEAFRYQKFLAGLIDSANSTLTESSQCLKTTRTHKKNAANPDAQDVTETVESAHPYSVDDTIALLEQIIEEKENLSKAIRSAKASIPFDIDCAIETNKARQKVSRAISLMSSCRPSKRAERGTDYKFNLEGNQTPYYYEIEVETTQAYDKAHVKDVRHRLIAEADRVSAEIDSAMINTIVPFEPLYDVNELYFDDIIADFISRR